MRVLLFLIVMCIPMNVLAQEVDRDVITYKGTKGFFFKLSIGDKLLKDVSELQILRKEKVALKLKVDLLEMNIKLRIEWLATETKISENRRLAQVAERAGRMSDQKHYEAIIRKKNGFWSKPGTWFAVGFVLASLAAVGLNFGLQEARSN